MNIDPEGTSWWSNLWNGLSNFFSKIGEGIGKIFSGIGNLFGNLVNYNNDFGFDFDIGLDFERKSLFERFIENIEDIRKDKKYFFKDILWDKVLKWASQNSVINGFLAVGGFIITIAGAVGYSSVLLTGAGIVLAGISVLFWLRNLFD